MQEVQAYKRQENMVLSVRSLCRQAEDNNAEQKNNKAAHDTANGNTFFKSNGQVGEKRI